MSILCVVQYNVFKLNGFTHISYTCMLPQERISTLKKSFFIEINHMKVFLAMLEVII